MAFNSKQTVVVVVVVVLVSWSVILLALLGDFRSHLFVSFDLALVRIVCRWMADGDGK